MTSLHLCVCIFACLDRSLTVSHFRLLSCVNSNGLDDNSQLYCLDDNNKDGDYLWTDRILQSSSGWLSPWWKLKRSIEMFVRLSNRTFGIRELFFHLYRVTECQNLYGWFIHDIVLSHQALSLLVGYQYRTLHTFEVAQMGHFAQL